MAPRKYSLGRRAASVEETRRRIVDAIVSLHAQKGVLSTSFEDIARRADVALGTVQRYFPSLNDMIRACGPRIVEITKPPGAEIISERHSFPERVKILVEELFAFYERAAPWLEVGRYERKKVPLLDADLRHLEQRLDVMIREAFRAVPIDQEGLKLVAALTDFYVWKSLSDQGMRKESAHVITQVLLLYFEAKGLTTFTAQPI